MSRILVIGGPTNCDYDALGVKRVGCTPADILGLQLTADTKCVIYWPDQTFLQPLPPESWRETIDKAGVFYEQYLGPEYYGKRRKPTKHKVSSKPLDPSMITGHPKFIAPPRRPEFIVLRKPIGPPMLIGPLGRFKPVRLNDWGVAELTYRATKAKLLELTALAIDGLICITVVPEDFTDYQSPLDRAFSWISLRLRIGHTRYASGIRLKPLAANAPAMLSAILGELPLMTDKWATAIDVADLGLTSPWSHHMAEESPDVELFTAWPHYGDSVTCVPTHVNGRGQVLSCAFLTGKGGIAVLPSVLGMGDLIALADNQDRIASAARISDANLLPFPLKLTAIRQMKDANGSSYAVEYQGQRVTMGEKAFIYLLAFVVSAKMGIDNGINVKRPEIREQSITAFFPPAENTHKPAQNVNDPLKEIMKQSVVTSVTGQSNVGRYRLAVSPESVDLSALKGCTDAAISFFMKLLDAPR